MTIKEGLFPLKNSVRAHYDRNCQFGGCSNTRSENKNLGEKVQAESVLIHPR